MNLRDGFFTLLILCAFISFIASFGFAGDGDWMSATISLWIAIGLSLFTWASSLFSIVRREG